MSISIYNSLLESYNSESLKETFKKNLIQIQKLIDKYINEDDENDYSDTLGMILNSINNVIKLFNSLGFTYEPDTTSDVDEDSFKTILTRYSNQIDKFLSNFNRNEFESFNTYTKYLSSLIDVHRTQYVEEGEILVDLSE